VKSHREAAKKFLTYVGENRSKLHRSNILNRAVELRDLAKIAQKKMIGKDNLLRGESGQHKRDHTRTFQPKPTIARLRLKNPNDFRSGHWERGDDGEDFFVEDKSDSELEDHESDFDLLEYERLLENEEDDAGFVAYIGGTYVDPREANLKAAKLWSAKGHTKAGNGRRLKGGARAEATKNRRSINNSGCGGKSKVPKPPSSTPEAVAKAKQVLKKMEEGNGQPEEENDDDVKQLWQSRLGVEPPGRTLFDGQDIEDFTVLHDVGAAPFCFMASMDSALGVEPDYDKYQLIYAMERKEAAALGEADLSVPNIVGSNDFAESYARHCGVNLIVHDVNDVPVLICDLNPLFKWVQLIYQYGVGSDSVGHFVIRMSIEHRDEKSGPRNKIGVTKNALFNSFLTRGKSPENFPEFGAWTQGGLPNQATLHKGPEFNYNSVAYDAHMSPFCGIGHVAMAMGKKITFAEAVEAYFVESRCQECQGRSVGNPPHKVVGDVEYVSRYALSLGANLVVFNERNRRIGRYEHCETFPWIHLKFIPLGGVNPPDVGHYVLLTTGDSGGQRIGSCTVHSLDEYKRSWYHFFGLITLFLCIYSRCVPAIVVFLVSQFFSFRLSWIVGERFVDPTNEDRRTLIDRRDDLKTQDSYREIKFCYKIFFYFGGSICLSVLPYGTVWSILISEVRFISAYTEMQSLCGTGRDYKLALAGIGGLREVNTNVSLNNIILNTIWFADLIGKDLEVTGGRCDTSGLIAVNEPGVFSGGMKFGAILQNQANVRVFGGQKLLPYEKRQRNNHVVSYRLERGKSGVPVAVAPIGALEVGGGKVVGAGKISLTDSPSLLAGFTRQMNVVPVSGPFLEDFLLFSIDWLEYFIQNTDVSGLIEGDCVDEFRIRYQGKKSVSYVNRICEMYKSFSDGFYSSRMRRVFE